MTDVESAIRDAMARRKTIRLEYMGEDEEAYHERELEPWVLGVHKDTGNRVVRAVQVGGHSETARPADLPAWRLARLDRMRNVVVTDTDVRLPPPADYNPDDPAMDPILRRLSE